MSSLKSNVATALKNDTLKGALGRFSEAYAVSRAKAYEGIDFEELRNKIAEIKGYAAEHFDELAEEFKRNAEAKGAKVFRANSPHEVKDYILELAKQKGVKSIVKSKSMASEEIHLNPYLEKEGIDVRETDLGEWIIQLAGERPSHMVMPAIHMTRDQVADLFSKEIEERLTNDIPRLVKVARKEMRPKFLAADMGISGGNIAVAETGTIALVTNEGNGRLVTSLPNIHVAIVGLEKMISKFEDAAYILKALPKSATGQLITSYVTMITGPTQNPDGTQKELHIILMDNRRTEMANDPKFKNALQCIRCASCLNVCPVYRLVGGHVYGHVYAGGIGTILTAWFNELKKSEEIQALCIMCGRCTEVCPGKVDIPEMIVEIRRRMVEKQGLPLAQKAIFSGVLSNRKLFHSLLRAASIGQKPFAKEGYIRHLPLFFSELAEFRSLPTIADVPLRDTIKKIKQPKGKEKVAFYAGCLIDFAYPNMGEAVVKILNKAGIEVVFPEDQTCCGAPARYSGAFDVATTNSIDNIKAFDSAEYKYIVSACPTCTVALKHDFIDNLKTQGKNEWLGKAEKISEKTIDFSTLVKKLVDEKRISFEEGKGLSNVTYHDSCHLKRTLKANQEPRQLLEKAGHKVKEMYECDMCCGMGGSYTVKMPEISAPILDRKLKNIEDTGTKIVAMDCPGCVMQIGGGLDKKNNGIKAMHTAEILAENIK